MSDRETKTGYVSFNFYICCMLAVVIFKVIDSIETTIFFWRPVLKPDISFQAATSSFVPPPHIYSTGASWHALHHEQLCNCDAPWIMIVACIDGAPELLWAPEPPLTDNRLVCLSFGSSLCVCSCGNRAHTGSCWPPTKEWSLTYRAFRVITDALVRI